MLDLNKGNSLDELERLIDDHIAECADSIVMSSLDALAWADEDYDDQDALGGVDAPICDEAACPVSELCPFGPGASGLSEDEVLDILESCELTHDRAKGLRGIPGLGDALEGAGWPVYRIGSADEA